MGENSRVSVNWGSENVTELLPVRLLARTHTFVIPDGVAVDSAHNQKPVT